MLLASTAQTLQVLTQKLYIVQDVKIDNQILKTVTECKILGVVIPDDFSGTQDIDRAKVSFFK